jgi:phosphoglycerate dehydrogenase-like enzyme
LETVLVSAHFGEPELAEMAAGFPDVRFVSLPRSGEVPDGASGATVLFRCTMSKPELQTTLGGAPALRWIHSCTAGFDQLMVPEIVDRGLLVTRSAASHHIPISEWVLTFILVATKRFPDLLRAQAEHRWHRPELEELGGKTVGIVGAGAIGTEVARRCQAFGMRVVATKRSPATLPYFDLVLGPDQLPRLLSESDYIVLACPLTTETRGMIGARELSLMKPTAFLINIARGGLIVDEDLVRALREHRIAGACLDAFTQEPLPPDSPLWDVERLIITPLANLLREPTLGY